MTISYTTKCTGDLGISVGDRVVAQLFVRGANDPIRFSVYDLVLGGDPFVFETLRGCDEKLFEIARREQAMVDQS